MTIRIAFAAALGLSASLAQDGDGLRLAYGGKRGDRIEARLKSRMDLIFEGDPTTVDHVRAMSPFFAFDHVTYEGPAVREVLRAPAGASIRIRDRFSKAKATGVYDDQAFEHEFDRSVAEQIPSEEKLKGILYFIFAAGRTFRVTPAGELTEEDPTQDPTGEALSLIQNPHPRFPDREVKVGESWETEWESRTTDKDTGGKIRFKQTVRFEKREGAKAVLAVTLEGRDNRDGKDKNGNVNEVRVSGTAKVTFDKARGGVAAYESAGEIEATARGTDPGSGTEYDLVLTIKGEGKMTPAE
jgi:hypothetical protein